MASAAIYSVPIAWGLTVLPIIGRGILVKLKGRMDNAKPREREAQVAGMEPALQSLAGRLLAAHNNQYETLGYYAAGVAIAVAVKVPPPTLTRLTGYYLKCRLAYVLAYAAPQVANGALRSLSFIGAMAAVGMLYAAAAETSISTF